VPTLTIPRLDKYSWREQEATINQTLPQFRISITYESEFDKTEKLRLHFVHKKSIASRAIPLLYCHGWPGSFLEVSKIIGPLSSPIPTHMHTTEDSPSFHVVAPSIPGFGFSESSKYDNFGLRDTAQVFDGLMRKLGYSRYLVHGSDWYVQPAVLEHTQTHTLTLSHSHSHRGFKIARMLAIHHPESCMGVHTVSPPTPPPSFSSNKATYLKYHISRLTGAKFSWLSFGYIPNDLRVLPLPKTDPVPPELIEQPVNRPQTIAYGLCDSPSGLLAAVLDRLHSNGQSHLWPPSDILNWTMLLWLPGPEAGLRWLHSAGKEDCLSQWTSVPLGVSSYHVPETVETTGPGAAKHDRATSPPPMWLESIQPVVWVKRTQGSAGFPAWDSASDLIVDLRQFCAQGNRDGWIKLPGIEPNPLGIRLAPPANDLGNSRADAHLSRETVTEHSSKHWFRWRWPFLTMKLRGN
jgi:pimeloyl-ACP methyl ester carboxylesterase